LETLSHNSILKIIKTGNPSLKSNPRKSTNRKSDEKESKTANTLYFSLPYCEFISYRETKSTVYQLISMSNKTALKLAFTIYDKNRNGMVDEDDLLQMISLSRTLTFM
jgi:Ca2+-binding EF-hand superfamily protein